MLPESGKRRSFLVAAPGAGLLCLFVSACVADPARQEPATADSPHTTGTSASEQGGEPLASSGQETQPQETPPAATESPTQQDQGTTPAQSEGAKPAGWVHGSLGVRYRARSGSDDSDQDLGAVLALDVANPEVPWISGHLQARADADIDGESGVFGELSDTWDCNLTSKLYLAYADIALDKQPEQSPGTLRVGRQSDPRLPEVLRLDGVSYLTRPMGERELELGAYGGIPVHLYESSSEGDRAFGAFAEGRPWEGGRARVDWMHLEDELVLGDQRDDLLALGLWQEVADDLRFEGAYSHLEGDPRDLRLRGFWDNPDSQTLVRVSYFQLLETQSANATELDPFFQQLLEYFPYRQTTLSVSQSLGEHTLVDLGIDVRRVTDSGDVGEFNREWERYYLTGTLSDVLAEGLALSLTVDRWDDDERDTSSFGADLAWQASRDWTASVGTYYSLYKYEFLELDERDDVRTYYVRAGYDVSASVALDLLYEFEDDDRDTYNTLRVGSVWRF
jgi:hypothetical protein